MISSFWTAKDYFEGSEDELREHVTELVHENIITNHAILTLCKTEGVEYKASDIKDAVQETIDEMITSDFGNRDTYIKALDESYMTDHYVRFVTEVDLIYSLLPLTLAENGKLSTSEDEIRDYIKENFVRTWHVMIANYKTKVCFCKFFLCFFISFFHKLCKFDFFFCA